MIASEMNAMVIDNIELGGLGLLRHAVRTKNILLVL